MRPFAVPCALQRARWRSACGRARRYIPLDRPLSVNPTVVPAASTPTPLSPTRPAAPTGDADVDAEERWDDMDIPAEGLLPALSHADVLPSLPRTVLGSPRSLHVPMHDSAEAFAALKRFRLCGAFARIVRIPCRVGHRRLCSATRAVHYSAMLWPSSLRQSVSARSGHVAGLALVLLGSAVGGGGERGRARRCRVGLGGQA
jgi:hypothetical protein